MYENDPILWVFTPWPHEKMPANLTCKCVPNENNVASRTNIITLQINTTLVYFLHTFVEYGKLCLSLWAICSICDDAISSILTRYSSPAKAKSLPLRVACIIFCDVRWRCQIIVFFLYERLINYYIYNFMFVELIFVYFSSAICESEFGAREVIE